MRGIDSVKKIRDRKKPVEKNKDVVPPVGHNVPKHSLVHNVQIIKCHWKIISFCCRIPNHILKYPVNFFYNHKHLPVSVWQDFWPKQTITIICTPLLCYSSVVPYCASSITPQILITCHMYVINVISIVKTIG